MPVVNIERKEYIPEPELAPCPFCGNTVSIKDVEAVYGGGRDMIVRCDLCRVGFRHTYDWAYAVYNHDKGLEYKTYTREQALDEVIRRWNRRTYPLRLTTV